MKFYEYKNSFFFCLFIRRTFTAFLQTSIVIYIVFQISTHKLKRKRKQKVIKGFKKIENYHGTWIRKPCNPKYWMLCSNSICIEDNNLKNGVHCNKSFNRYLHFSDNIEQNGRRQKFRTVKTTVSASCFSIFFRDVIIFFPQNKVHTVVYSF